MGSIVDWYKQESEISRFRMGLQRVLLNYGVSKNQVKSEVDDIVKSIINIVDSTIKREWIIVLNFFREEDYEKSLIELFQNDLEYEYVYGSRYRKGFL